MIAEMAREGFRVRRWTLAAQDLDELFELEPHLVNQLLALIEIHLRIVAREAVARAADGEALLVQQTANLANDRARPGAGSSGDCRDA